MLTRALAEAQRHTDAVAACHEGLVAITPFVERDAQAFGDLARALFQIYIAAIAAAAEKTGALDEKALAELPSGLAEELRAAWAAAQARSDSKSPDGWQSYNSPII